MNDCSPLTGIVGRREFLKLTGASLVALTLPACLRRPGLPSTLLAERLAYPKVRIGQLSALEPGLPLPFRYPWDHPASTNFLIMLYSEAAAGVGSEQNVVAFNSFCTHQGGPLAETIHGQTGIAGPCPLHLTTFDLNRHSMVISGHATLGLSQIVLETEADDIYAVGVQGLIYGYSDNRLRPMGTET